MSGVANQGLTSKGQNVLSTRSKVMKVIAKATGTQQNSGTTFFHNSIDDAI